MEETAWEGHTYSYSSALQRDAEGAPKGPVLTTPTLASLSSAGTHSLCYDFTVSLQPAPGQQWCTVQAQVDRKTFLSYNCGVDKVKTLSALGEKVNATVTWREQNTALRDMGQMLRQQLADIKAENPRARGKSEWSKGMREPTVGLGC